MEPFNWPKEGQCARSANFRFGTFHYGHCLISNPGDKPSTIRRMFARQSIHRDQSFGDALNRQAVPANELRLIFCSRAFVRTSLINSSTDQIIETTGHDTLPAFAITKVATTPGNYEIIFEGYCANPFGCTPTVAQSRARFESFMLAQ